MKLKQVFESEWSKLVTASGHFLKLSKTCVPLVKNISECKKRIFVTFFGFSPILCCQSRAICRKKRLKIDHFKIQTKKGGLFILNKQERASSMINNFFAFHSRVRSHKPGNSRIVNTKKKTIWSDVVCHL